MMPIRAINPRRVVPSLVLEDGTAIGEVPVICRYVEETHPTPPLLGETAKEKAQVSMWQRRAELEGFAAVMEAIRNFGLIGFGGALRRSELVALDVADIEETETGLLVKIRGSKTDQERAGATIAIARGDIACPAKALREWLKAAGIEAGPIFRPIDKGGTVRASRLSDRSVANIVKAYAKRAGFDASTFSGHSLRAGFITSAAGKGASIFKMMDVSRHKSVDTLRGYVRDAELFKDHAGTGLL
jgi:glutathione S-transferase